MKNNLTYALKMNRNAIGIELNSEYYRDGLFYVKAMSNDVTMPTLFDVKQFEKAI